MRQRSNLRLVFQQVGGRTALVDSSSQGALRVIRPFLVDSTAVVQIMHVGPGALAGDEYELDITVGPECRVVVTHQSATRIHPMPPGQFARQDIRLTVGERGRLDYLPGLNIPFSGASFRQRIEVEIGQTSELGLLESWAMGRTARDEYMEFQVLDSTTSVRRGRESLYSDRLLLHAGDSGKGLMENYRYYASGYWFGLTVPPGKASPIEQENPLVAFGPVRPGEAFFRCLARDSAALHLAQNHCLDAVTEGRGERRLSLARFHG